MILTDDASSTFLKGLKKIDRISLSPPHGRGGVDCVCHGDEPRPRVWDELLWKRNVGRRGYSSEADPTIENAVHLFHLHIVDGIVIQIAVVNSS